MFGALTCHHVTVACKCSAGQGGIDGLCVVCASNVAGLRPQHQFPTCTRLSLPAAEIRPLEANLAHPEKLTVWKSQLRIPHRSAGGLA